MNQTENLVFGGDKIISDLLLDNVYINKNDTCNILRRFVRATNHSDSEIENRKKYYKSLSFNLMEQTYSKTNKETNLQNYG